MAEGFGTASGAIGQGFESLRARQFLVKGPSLRSGFRQRAPASLTPAKRLKFESLRARQFLVKGPSLRSGFRQRAPASLTPAKRLKFESLRARQFRFLTAELPASGKCGISLGDAPASKTVAFC